MLRTLTALSIVALVGAAATMSRAASDNYLVPGEVQKMQAALPASAQNQPAKPRKVLVFSLARMYAHPVAALGAKTFELMGKKTEAWETVTSEDPKMFAADKLAAFDAVVFNNTSGTCFDDPVLQKNLLDFVKGGKGFVGIHGAADTFHDWKEYGEMLGGRFNGHPWRMAVVKIDDPKSPLNAAFDGGFKIMEEIYTFKEPFSRQTNHVLLSMDMPASKLGGGNRTDNDYALAWCRPYGQGRVFYSAFGNDVDVYYNPLILKHWCDGIQWALGDLKADATPSK